MAEFLEEKIRKKMGRYQFPMAQFWTLTAVAATLFSGHKLLGHELLGHQYMPNQSVNPINISMPGRSTALPIAQVPQLEKLETLAHKQVNEYRASKNLSALKLDSRITEQCRRHSQSMAKGAVSMGHAGFKTRAQVIGQGIPYQAIAENVAFNSGYAHPELEAVNGWIKSDGHRQNMEGDYTFTGVGVARNAKGEYYFTQIFVRNR
ncbi:MAG: CAP domain-containing protein [Microcoleaceae cyanobacterium]